MVDCQDCVIGLCYGLSAMTGDLDKTFVRIGLWRIRVIGRTRPRSGGTVGTPPARWSVLRLPCVEEVRRCHSSSES